MTSSWPGDSATVVEWVRAQITVGDPTVEIDGLERIRVAADLEADDLRALSVDATDVRLTVRKAADYRRPSKTGTTPDAAGPAGPIAGDAGPDAATRPPTPGIVRRATGVARSIRISAAPVRVHRTPIHFDAHLHDVPIVWTEYDRPRDEKDPFSIRALETAGDGEGATGSFSFSIAVADIPRVVARVLKPLLPAPGLRLGRIRVELEQESPTTVRIAARAGLIWWLVPASARATARIELTPDGVVTVHELDVRSHNPLVALPLHFARPEIQRIVGRSIPLNADDLPPHSPRIRDVRVQAYQDLRITGRIA